MPERCTAVCRSCMGKLEHSVCTKRSRCRTRAQDSPLSLYSQDNALGLNTQRGTMKLKIRGAQFAQILQVPAVWSGKLGFILTAKMQLFSRVSVLSIPPHPTGSIGRGFKLSDNHPLGPCPGTWSADLLSSKTLEQPAPCKERGPHGAHQLPSFGSRLPM